MADLDPLKNIERLFKQKSLLDIAIEVEKFLDFINVFVYPNWLEGEVVDGPNVSRYWVTITLRYDYKKMPDPMGARILHDIGVIVNYNKTIMMEPIKVKSPADFRPNSKKPRLLPKKIWEIEIKIPRRFIDDIDYNDLEDFDVDEVDAEDVNSAADQDMINPEDLTKRGQEPEAELPPPEEMPQGGAPNA